MNTAVKAILTQYQQEIEKAVEHGVWCERTWNVAKMQAVKAEVEQVKKELAKERGQTPC